MKKVILLGLVLIMTAKPTFAQTQSKPIYTLESVPYYDENGNVYGTIRRYDHLPTRQDSLNFRIESEKEIRIMMDSTAKASAPKPRKKTYSKKSK